MLGTKPGPPERVASALNYWATIFAVPQFKELWESEALRWKDGSVGKSMRAYIQVSCTYNNRKREKLGPAVYTPATPVQGTRQEEGRGQGAKVSL